MMKKSNLLKLGLGLICFIFLAISLSAQEEQGETYKYNDNGKRDPFWSLVTSGGVVVNYDKDFTISDLTLDGVILGKKSSDMAIISGKIVREGDLLGQYSIFEINKNFVLLQQDGQEFRLNLKKGE
jgi:hypothetical protein